MVEVGADGAIDTMPLNQPVIAFVVGQTGLMAEVSVEGAKITRLQRR